MAHAVIIGCGYVGIELGTQLQAAGHTVTGVRRSKSGLNSIEAAGFHAQQADVTHPETLSTLPDAEWVIFAASSGGRGAESARRIYVDGLRNTIAAYAERESTDRLIYTSSTGVYGDHNGRFVDESTSLDPTTEKTQVLKTAESITLEETGDVGIDGTVARFAGLYGPNRYRLTRYLSGPVTEGYLNMIHRDDAAGVINHVLTADVAREECVLAVDDEPADKWTFADWIATACGRPDPPKQTVSERLAKSNLSETAQRRVRTSKRCSNDYLHELDYTFSYPTYREGYAEPTAAVADGADPDTL
ncbi:SDR family oxidoreductase [Haloquadratum walsbyi]|uniref:Homolog to NAD-dependent epimerase/dehydratase n=1 Tax=Haloquadratum walsbyi (strain DSM 16790 / HBSQ001) TaxID=362976 RepID=Q18E03_HALWD|nr:SDR family oxidoreductase [Haloquadratum walsbyi]CAJ51313.1 homolog to NAD-dependent epimerase/dehydratase [Haloquadratum walsbyi DSM 16790]